MRILILTLRMPYPPNDGGALAMWELLKAFQQSGFSVTLFAVNTLKHYQNPQTIRPFVSELFTTTLNTNPNIFHALYAFCSGKAYNIERFHSKAHQSNLKKHLTNQKFDLILFEGVYLSYYIDTLREILPDTPILLRAHNVEFQIWQKYASEADSVPISLKQKLVNTFKKVYFKHLAHRGKKFEILSFPKYDGIIAFTDHDAKQIQQLGYQGPVTTIPANFSLPPVQQIPVSEMQACLNIGFLASLEWLPNVQGLDWFLNEVWNLVVSKCPDAVLNIAGKRTPARYFDLQSPQINVLGTVPDAVAFLNTQTIVIVPLLSGSGIRMKLIEAMALGKCIVTTTQGVQGIGAQHKEEILIADTPQAFANAIAEALTNPALRNQIAQNALGFAQQHFGVEAILKQWTQFWNPLLKY